MGGTQSQSNSRVSPNPHINRGGPNGNSRRRSSSSRIERQQRARSGATAIPMQYPMWLMPVSTFVGLAQLRPHQEFRAAGKLVQWDRSMTTVFFLSHQWTSFSHPDHSTEQLRTIQKVLLRMYKGELPDTGLGVEDKGHLRNNVDIVAKQWQRLVPDAYIWLDFISVRSRKDAVSLR